MSSDPSSALELLQLDNCMFVMVVSAACYDYVLTFAREVEYVWGRNWTWGSTIFILVRYPGLYWAITNALRGTSFMPGPAMMYVSRLLKGTNGSVDFCAGVRTVFYMVEIALFGIFLTAADLMMILRVYAVWSQSRRVLCILLLILAAQSVISIVMTVIYLNPKTYLLVTLSQVEDFLFCTTTLKAPWIPYASFVTIPRFILGFLLFGFATVQALKELVEGRSMRGWELNRYIKLFVKHGLLYFSLYTAYNVIAIVDNGLMASSAFMLSLSSVPTPILCSMMPRFMIGVRELYDRDSQGVSVEIDGGFGMTPSLGFGPVAGQTATTPPVMTFAEGAQHQDLTMDQTAGDSEAIELGVIGDGACRV